jgi:hypothetical protein
VSAGLSVGKIGLVIFPPILDTTCQSGLLVKGHLLEILQRFVREDIKKGSPTSQANLKK